MSDLLSQIAGTLRFVASVAGLTFWFCLQAGEPKNIVVDETPVLGTGADSTVTSIALQPDGKLLIAGYFRQFDGQQRSGLLRLLPSGRIDPQFQATGVDGIQSGFNRVPAGLTVQLQPDGRILFAGEFTRFNGQPHTNLVRLFPDGGLDPSFRAAATVDRHGFSQPVFISSLQQASDGKIYIGGQFRLEGRTPYESGNLVARLNSDGSEDPSFTLGTFTGQIDYVRSMATQGDQVFLGGYFNVTGLGVGTPGLPMVWSPLVDFNDSKIVHALAVLPDGRVVAGGGFTWNGWPEPRVPWKARLGVVRPNASLEPFPGFEADSAIHTIVPESDGTLLVGGSFRTVNGSIRGGIARFLPDQHLDRCFVPGSLISGSLSGQPSSIRSLVRTTDGGIWIAGDFTRVDGQIRNGLARLLDRSYCSSNLVEFASSHWLANEADTIATVVLSRRGQANGVLSVWFETVGGTALPGDDYRAVRQKVEFGPGENSQVVEIPLIAEGKSEGEETIELRLLPDSGAGIGLGQATLTIQEQDLKGSEWSSSGSNLSSAMAEDFWIDPEGRLVISEMGNGTMRRLVRQTAQGTVDPEWKPATVDGYIYACSILSDGRVFIAGQFSSVNGQPRDGIAWMLPKGDLDTTVDGPKGSKFGPTSYGRGFYGAAPQQDGAVLLSGYFTVSGGAGIRTNLVRLLRDGQVDAEAYNPANPGTSTALVRAPNWGALVRDGDGWFRLLPNGRLDLEFRSRIPGHELIYPALVLPDGRIMALGSDFQTSEQRAFRLLPDGRVDPSFRPVSGLSLVGREPSFIAHIRGFTAAPKGPLLLWGFFDQLGTLPLSLLAPLTLDGRPDAWNTILWPVADKRTWSIAKAEYAPQGGLIVLATDWAPGKPWENFLWRFSPASSPGPSSFSVRIPVQQVSENVGTVEVEIARTGDASGPATVYFGLDELGATVGEDFEAGGGRLNFGVGERAKRLAIPISDDRRVEPAESFRIRITGVEGGVLGEVSAGIVTITDNDFAVEFDTDHWVVAERNGRVDLPVRMVGVTPPLPLTVRITSRPRTASENSDYQRLEGTIRFESKHQAVQWLTLKVLDDAQPELNESLEIEIEALDASAGIAGPRTIGITIQDDDSNEQGGLGIDGTVRAIQAQPDGKILVAGQFERVNGELRPAVARIADDGTLDRSFQTEFKPGASAQILTRQLNGTILVSETVTNGSGQLRSQLIRLMPDGRTDLRFTPVVADHAPGTFNTTRPPIRAIAALRSGSLLIGGSFSEINGVSRIGFARIKSDGTLDESFRFDLVGHPFGGGSEINTFATTSTGQIVAGGLFSSVGGAGRNGMVLLSTEGIPDALNPPQLTGAMVTPIGFPPEPWESHNRVEFIRILPGFSSWIIYRSEGSGGGGGFPVEYPVAKMHDARRRDRRFDQNLPYRLLDVRTTPTFLESLPDNKILIGVDNTLIRLNSDGTEDTTFTPPIVDWPSLVGTEPQGQGQFWSALATDTQRLWLGGSFRRLGTTLRPSLTTIPYNGRNPDPPSFLPPQILPDGRVVLLADTEPNKPITWEVFQTGSPWSAAKGWISPVDTRVFVPEIPSTNCLYRFYVP